VGIELGYGYFAEVSVGFGFVECLKLLGFVELVNFYLGEVWELLEAFGEVEAVVE
jgi:hypothetical protein